VEREREKGREGGRERPGRETEKETRDRERACRGRACSGGAVPRPFLEGPCLVHHLLYRHAQAGTSVFLFGVNQSINHQSSQQPQHVQPRPSRLSLACAAAAFSCDVCKTDSSSSRSLDCRRHDVMPFCQSASYCVSANFDSLHIEAKGEVVFASLSEPLQMKLTELRPTGGTKRTPRCLLPAMRAPLCLLPACLVSSLCICPARSISSSHRWIAMSTCSKVSCRGSC
jgi:hypothetical protein